MGFGRGTAVCRYCGHRVRKRLAPVRGLGPMGLPAICDDGEACFRRQKAQLQDVFKKLRLADL